MFYRVNLVFRQRKADPAVMQTASRLPVFTRQQNITELPSPSPACTHQDWSEITTHCPTFASRSTSDWLRFTQVLPDPARAVTGALRPHQWHLLHTRLFGPM